MPHLQLLEILLASLAFQLLHANDDLIYKRREADIETLEGLSIPSTVQQILLEVNLITTLPENVFISYSQLKRLDMSHNNIQYIFNGTFNGLFNMDTLDLSYNNLNKFPNLTDSVSSLRSLNLAQNSITALPVSYIQMFEKLRWFNIASNMLTSLSSWPETPELQTLHLSANLAQRLLSQRM